VHKKACDKQVLIAEFLNTVSLLQKGMELNIDGEVLVVSGDLLHYCGDALATHSVGGFKESFSPRVTFSCRCCMTRSINFQNIFYHNEGENRTDSLIKKQVKYVEEGQSDIEKLQRSKEVGLKSASIFTTIENFSLTSDLMHDVMHVLLEGIIPKETTLFLKYLIKNGHTTRKKVNTAISSFKYCNTISKSDYIREFDVSLKTICKAKVAIIIITHLPYILKNEISMGPHLRCYMLLCKISQLCLSHDVPGFMVQKI
jgi:hypothetical protein